MDKVKEVKDVLRRHIGGRFPYNAHGLFDTRNHAGDEMETIYKNEGVTVEFCAFWEYYEIFGLTEEEFLEVKSYYQDLVEIIDIYYKILRLKGEAKEFYESLKKVFPEANGIDMRLE